MMKDIKIKFFYMQTHKGKNRQQNMRIGERIRYIFFMRQNIENKVEQ